MEITANNTKELLVDYGAELMALAQKGETDKLAKLTDDAHEELLFLIKEQTSNLYEALKASANCNPSIPIDIQIQVQEALARAEGK